MRYRVVVVRPLEKAKNLVTHGKTMRVGRSVIIPDNYASPRGRLYWLVKRLKWSPEVLQKCNRVMQFFV